MFTCLQCWCASGSNKGYLHDMQYSSAQVVKTKPEEQVVDPAVPVADDVIERRRINEIGQQGCSAGSQAVEPRLHIHATMARASSPAVSKLPEISAWKAFCVCWE